MSNVILNRAARKIYAPISIFVWLFLWICPWTTWLDSMPWIRLGAGITIFVFPGMLASLLLARDRFTLLGHLTGGFAFSIFIVSILGLAGRIFHLSLEFINLAFASIGVILLFILGWHTSPDNQLYKPRKANALTLFVLICIAMFAAMVSIGNEISSDDFSYLAHLTHWQHAQPLDFSDAVFGAGGMDQIRFWLAMFPMDLAFLAKLTNLHGLFLLGLYLEPLFIVISLVSLYNLYEDILEGYLPIVAILLQVTFLYMLQGYRQPGSMFFYRISEDKVFAAFMLAPVFFLSLRHLLESVTFKSSLYVLLCGWSLSLTHPIILAYSVMIAGFYVLFSSITRWDYKKIGITMILLVVIILPPASLRFAGTPWVGRYIFGSTTPLEQPGSFDFESASSTIDAETIISNIKGTSFYGFNLDRVKIYWGQTSTTKENIWEIFLSRIYLWILGLAFLWSILNIKKKKAAPFMAAAALLVLICAIPYTGWLIGRLVSARMLWRAPWMFPIGMASAILIDEFINFIFKIEKLQLKRRFSVESAALGLTTLFSLGLIVYFSSVVYKKDWSESLTLNDERKRLETFVNLGNYLEAEVESASIFAAPRSFSDYLPGISSKSKVVFFRHDIFTPDNVNIDELNMLFSHDKSFSINQRIDIVKKYKIQYIVFDENFLEKYYTKHLTFFDIHKSGTFWILRYKK